MSAKYKILMHRYNGNDDYDDLYPISAEATDVFDGYTTPQQWGADDTGATDATSEIQSALDTGKIVIFDGIFKIDDTLTLPSNAYLIGHNCKLVPSYDENGVVNTMFSGTSVENVIFENLNFEGTYTGSTPTINDNAFSHSLIEISGGDSVTFKDCTFTNIDGVLCQQYDDATAAQSFWKQNGDIITLRGVTNSLIHNCTLNHACVNSAIWILPALSSSSLDGFNATVDGLNVIGINDSNPPLNVLCESATIKNVYYDEDCSGVVDGSAMYLFALNLNVDNINCLGTYATIISCDGLGKFQNDNVNISNVNVVCQSAIAITCVAKSCNIVNLTGSMNSAVVVNNVVDSDLSATFFPWKMLSVIRVLVNIDNANIFTYNGNHPVFMIYGSPLTENGQFNISNSKIDIQTINTTYQPFTLYGGSLVMNNVTVCGDVSVLTPGDLDWSKNIKSNDGEYVVYYGGISSSTISKIMNDSIDIVGCKFYRSPQTTPRRLCTINGCIGSINISSNDLIGLQLFQAGVSGHGNSWSYTNMIVGNYVDSIIFKNNTLRYAHNIHNTANGMLQIASRHYDLDFPIALSTKRRGDLVINNNNVIYNVSTVDVYYTKAASGSTISGLYVGDIIQDTFGATGSGGGGAAINFAQCAYAVIWVSSNGVSTGSSGYVASDVGEEEGRAGVGEVYAPYASSCITVCINNDGSHAVGIDGAIVKLNNGFSMSNFNMNDKFFGYGIT